MQNQTGSWCVRVMLVLRLLAMAACTGTVGETPGSQAAVDRAENLTITVLGNAVLDAFKDGMSQEDHRQVQRLIDDADAKSLLEWPLRFQQVNHAS